MLLLATISGLSAGKAQASEVWQGLLKSSVAEEVAEVSPLSFPPWGGVVFKEIPFDTALCQPGDEIIQGKCLLHFSAQSSSVGASWLGCLHYLIILQSSSRMFFVDGHLLNWAFLVVQVVKNLPASAGNAGSIPGSGRSPGRGCAW